MFSTPVILCPVHRILWQQVTNLINKFALLLHKYRFTQDSRNKSENDWCRERLLDTICKFFKYPSPADKSATSPARGEVNGLLSFARNDNRVRGEISYGRSMIEMLGVLAIIGVLSISGIAGYSKAIMKFKINKVIDEYNSFIFGLLEHKDSLYKLADGTGYADIANSLNIFPQTWTYTDARFAKDSMEQTLQMWKASGWIETNHQDPTLIFETYFNSSEHSKYYESVQTLHFCRALFSDFAVPSAGVLKFATLWRNTPSSANIYWHGNATCAKNTPCLKNLTFTQIDEQCRTCADTKGSCTLLFGF